MKRAMLWGGAVVIGTCLTAAFGSAQGVTRTAGMDEAGNVTATGCLTRTANSGVGSEHYVLTGTLLPPDSTVTGNRDTGASGSPGYGSVTPPTPPNPPSSSPGNSTASGATGRNVGGGRYLVSGVSTEELRKHLNQQVEVRGALERRMSESAAGPNLPKLKASSIRTVSTSCKPAVPQP